MRVPWKTILMHAPTLVDAARAFYGTTRRAGPEDPREEAGDVVEALRGRVRALEEREARHAALFADLARQVQELTTALEVLRVRAHIALAGAGVALAISLLTAAVVLWRGR